LLKIATIVQLFLENQKRGICAGDVAMPVVIKAYSHQSLKQLCRKARRKRKLISDAVKKTSKRLGKNEL